MTRVQEVETKLAWVREALAEAGRSLCRLHGSDWFAWATAGGSSAVLMTAETGVAEVIVGIRDAFVLTDHSKAGRLRAWNLSVRGAKIEDTIALTEVGLEVLTLDPTWPQVTVTNLPHPLVMKRTYP